MPRGQKSKLRAREKRRQAQGEAQLKAQADTHDPEGAQATTGEEKGSPHSSSPSSGKSPQSFPAAGFPQGPERVPSTTTDAACVCGTKATVGAEGQEEGRASSSQAPPPTEKSQRDPLSCRVFMLLGFLLEKYKAKKHISKADMIKIINKRFKEQFPEILRRASEHIEVIFGLEVKEVDSKGQYYTIVRKWEISKEENIYGGGRYHKNGLLLPLLGLMYVIGKRATEEKIWQFLNSLGVYDGERHIIFGDPRKLITKDLVQEKYLEYQQVPNSDPPRYEFLWGPRAYDEANKTKVLEFLAKVSDMKPSTFQALYEEIRREKEGGAATEVGSLARARAHFME
ncbi:melanoma-associated antigen B2-like [Orycteropus afer afer]|uniref:Melanoma-associated antigen B2-like n=1 Tax=Orycteropus afer afer TaxID=1230840 RepID=A0A8B7B3X0_ORYAF|nr:melanoma-associated antigen B2-like [Orycteropus afer afer]